MSNIFEIINKYADIDNEQIFHCVNLNDEIENKIEAKDNPKYQLLKNVMSIFIDVQKNTVEFKAAMVWGDRRSFAPEDIAEEEYSFLKEIMNRVEQPCIKAKIGDLIWNQKKNIDVAKVAINEYKKIYEEIFTEEEWLTSLEIAHRIISISIETEDSENYEWILNDIYQKASNNIYLCNDMLIVWLLEILIREKYKEEVILDNMILESMKTNSNQGYVLESLFKLRKELYKNNKKKLREINKDLAVYYEKQADKKSENDFQNCALKEELLKKANRLYCECNEQEKSVEVQKKIVLLQKKIPGMMHVFKQKIDLGNIKSEIEKSFEGLSFEESIIRLSQFTIFRKYDDEKEKVIKGNDSIIESMFGKSIINKNGQVILNLNPLNRNNPEANKALLDDYVRQELYTYQNFDGSTVLNIAISIIKEKFEINMEKFDFLVNNNAIIPRDRENVIKMALDMFFSDKKYEAIHILIPQTENIFRNIATELGGLTVKLKANGTSEDKMLTDIFKIPELKAGYNNDILFIFEGLLNKQSGANIRNKVAHGIVEPYEIESGVYTYYVCALIKILVFSSSECLNYFNKSEKLKERL